MSASNHEFSESSSMDSPQSRDSPYSSPSQQVPHLANAFSGITCGDDVAFHIDDKKPYLRIVHHPQDHFRFRYKSELVGTHGCLLGKTSDNIRTKSHPTVELLNYTGKALIRARLAQVDKDEEHPHQLIEDDEDREVSALVPQQGSYKVGFAGMGIIHKPKKHITVLLMKKYMNRKIDGSKSMSAKELRAHCENIAKEINLNIVRLRFSAHDVTTDKEICPPVFSEPIHNEKSAATNDLKICRISRYFGRPRGGDDVFILVEKVNKKNIVIRFYELDDDGEEVWSANGNFLQSDVHHQYAIVFRTPPYRDPQITKDVKVYIELVRPTDGRTSERKEFVYKADLAFRDNKRKRVNSSFSSLDSSSGGSVKNMNEVPTTVEMLDQGDRDAISNIPVFQINIPQIPVTAAAPNDLADALLYSAGGVGGVGGPSPMLGAPNVPEPPIINIDSGEFERLIQHDPDLSSDDRRNLGGMDWTEYMQSFGDSLTDKTLGSMDYLRRSMELVADSGNGRGVIKTEPVSPSKPPSVEERKNAVHQDHKNEIYTAFYTIEDGKEVKKLVREICEIMKNKTGYKKHVVKNKLERLFEMRLSNGDTFLHMALASNQPSLEYVVRLVHAMRMPRLLNLRNDRRQTALHLALAHDLPALLDTLLDKGCDPSAADAEGNNAIHYAVVYRACLKPLLEAIKKFHLQCDVNACNNEKQTPLHLASMYDTAASVELLVQHGCSVTARDALGRTPLHLAVIDDCHAAAEALIHLTPKNDIDAVDGAGNTALQIVCLKERICSEKVNIIKMLIDKEADPYARGGTAAAAGLRGAREPALRGLFPPPADDDVKSEPDDYESADEGDADGTLSGLSLWLGAVSQRLDARGTWRELAARLHADALLSWYGNTASPTSTLLTHIKESGDNVTSKSLMMHLQDMGETDSANIIRQYIE